MLLSADPLTITDYRAFPDGQSNEVVYSPDPAPSRGSDARVVTYDPVTGKQRRLSKADSASARASIEVLDYTTHQAFADLGEFVEGQRAADVTLDGPDGQLVQPVDGGTEYQPNFIFGGDQRTLVPNTQVTPHRQIGRVWMNFGGRESSCSGTMIGPFHVLTAGHCMHTDGEWADSITFSPGQTGNSIDSGFSRSDFQPYGEARATQFTTFNAWTQNANFDWDIGLLTLDRNVGNTTGWFGFGWNTSSSFYSGNTSATAGYPGDLTPNDYDQWEENSANAISYGITTHQLRSNTMDIFPGQSGSAHWWGGDSSPVAHGVVSHGYHPGGVPTYNASTRITETKFNSLVAWKDGDTTPTDRPDLVDWDQWFNASTSSINKTSLEIGDSLSVTANIRNNGTSASGNYSVSFYASQNTTITTSDRFLGNIAMPSLSQFQWDDARLTISDFPDIPTGDYYIGWIIDSGNSAAEFLESNNTGLVTGQRLNVRPEVIPVPFVDSNNDGVFNGSDVALVNGELSDGIFSTKKSEGAYTSVVSGAGLVIPAGAGSVSASKINLLADGNILVGETLVSTSSHVTLKSLSGNVDVTNTGQLISGRNVLVTAKRDARLNGLVVAISNSKGQIRVKANRDIYLTSGTAVASRKVDAQAAKDLFATSATVIAGGANAQVRLIAKNGILNATSADIRAQKKIQIESRKGSVVTTNATIGITSSGTNSSSIRVKAKTSLISSGANYYALNLNKITRLFASETGTPGLNVGTLSRGY